jgi:hypothetical protein
MNFLLFTDLFLLKENLGLIWVFNPKMNGIDLIKMRGYLASNLERSSPIRQLGRLLLYSMASAIAEVGECHGWRLGKIKPCLRYTKL